MLLETVNF